MKILLGILSLVIGIILLTQYVSMSFTILNSPTKNVTTDCYDRYFNKINGVTCSKEVYVENAYNGSNGMYFGIIGLIMFILSMFFTVNGLIIIINSIFLIDKVKPTDRGRK